MKTLLACFLIFMGIVAAEEGIELPIIVGLTDSKELVADKAKEVILDEDFQFDFNASLQFRLENGANFQSDLVPSRKTLNDKIASQLVRLFQLNWYEMKKSYDEDYNYIPSPLGRLANNKFVVEKFSNLVCPIFSKNLAWLTRESRISLKLALMNFKRVIELDYNDEKNHVLLAKHFGIFKADFPALLKLIKRFDTKEIDAHQEIRIESYVHSASVQVLAFVIRRNHGGLSEGKFDELMATYMGCADMVLEGLEKL
jgi:hypothetical protein